MEIAMKVFLSSILFLLLTVCCDQSVVDPKQKAKAFMEEWKQNGPKAAAVMIHDVDERQWFLTLPYADPGPLQSEQVLVNYDFDNSEVVNVKGFLTTKHSQPNRGT